MGNVHMEATQINYREGDKKMSVAQAIKNAGNTGLAHTEDIAPEFSTESAYNAGDFVYYNGSLYEFTANHAAGAWSTADTQATTISNELASLENGLTHLESGTETFTDLTAGTNNFITVYFGRAYTTPPVVMATLNADGTLSGASCAVRDITTTTAKIYARNSGASDATIKVNWGAIGI